MVDWNGSAHVKQPQSRHQRQRVKHVSDKRFGALAVEPMRFDANAQFVSVTVLVSNVGSLRG